MSTNYTIGRKANSPVRDGFLSYTSIEDLENNTRLRMRSGGSLSGGLCLCSGEGGSAGGRHPTGMLSCLG